MWPTEMKEHVLQIASFSYGTRLPDIIYEPIANILEIFDNVHVFLLCPLCILTYFFSFLFFFYYIHSLIYIYVYILLLLLFARIGIHNVLMRAQPSTTSSGGLCLIIL